MKFISLIDWGLRGLLGLGTLYLSACGDSTATDSTPESSAWVKSKFQPAAAFAGMCVSPRNNAFDIKGTLLDENNWLRSMSNELYLWYDEIEDKNPIKFNNLLEYFDQLKTFAITASGRPKDKFHYFIPTDEWQKQTQSGVSIGYGFQWALISAEPPRKAVIAYLDQESSDTLPSGIARGVEVLKVDGVDLANSYNVETLNNGMWPSTAGKEHTFELLPLGAAKPITIKLTAKATISDPVQYVKSTHTASGTKVGYMLFNDHIATAEAELMDAVSFLSTEKVEELVLDIRYNGGGYLDMASQLAYMIAGDTTEGRTFELVKFNDKHPNINPVTNEQITPTPFHKTSLGFTNNQPRGIPLPTLNLNRVFVLTSENTCSASEAIINSLRGIDVEVVQIGHTTCGKPYGFYPLDNCGFTYFTVQFTGVNAKGFGGYAGGFTPGATRQTEASLPGCEVGDDFTHPLGDIKEALFGAAINYINTGSCGAMLPGSFSASLVEQKLSDIRARVPKNIARSNRIMVMP